MSNNLHNELRKEFQLERLILFSDAVFAITEEPGPTGSAGPTSDVLITSGAEATPVARAYSALIMPLLYELECSTVKVRSISNVLDSAAVRLWYHIGYTTWANCRHRRWSIPRPLRR